ncbi:hypothetical protein R0J93_23430, partial [Pseudoalteromonas sp. SIMBA_148]
AFEKAPSLPETVELIIPVPNNHFEPAVAVPVADVDTGTEVLETVSLETMIKQSWANGLPDPDILAVFLEEAEELTNRNKYLHLFLKDTGIT